MRDEHYSPFAGRLADEPPRERIVVFLVTKDVRTMTGSLRAVDSERWEALYLLDGTLYQSQVCGTRAAAEAHLVQHREAVTAAGWTSQP